MSKTTSTKEVIEMRKPTPEEITEATQPIVNDMGLSIEEACKIFHGGFCCREDCSNCTEQEDFVLCRTEQNEIIKCVNIDYCGHDSTIMAKERFRKVGAIWICTNCLSDAHDHELFDSQRTL